MASVFRHCPTHTMDHRQLDARWCALQRSSMRCPRCHGAVAQTLQVFRCCGHHGKMLGDVQRQENQRHAKTRLATFLCSLYMFVLLSVCTNMIKYVPFPARTSLLVSFCQVTKEEFPQKCLGKTHGKPCVTTPAPAIKLALH